jgi:hypothetical protein
MTYSNINKKETSPEIPTFGVKIGVDVAKPTREGYT